MNDDELLGFHRDIVAILYVCAPGEPSSIADDQI